MQISLSKSALKFVQFDLSIYISTFTIEELVELTFVDIFDSETLEGYQRPISSLHFKNIAKFLLIEEDPIMIPSILTAIDKENLEFDKNTLKIKGKMRLVDGQHRIEAFKFLKTNFPNRFNELANLELPVTIMEIEDNKIHEINTFININSKGKKVSTDLAIRLRDVTRQHFKNNEDLIEALATKIAIKLNNEIYSSVWYDAIKISPELKGKIISINAFNRSLSPLISNYLKKENITFSEIDSVKFEYALSQILYLVEEAWEIISNKWSRCFEEKIPKFQTNYNIQKGVGTYSLHLLLNECYENNSGDISATLQNFRDVIEISIVDEFYWISGGEFSGMSSQSGFSKIKDVIKQSKSI